MNQICIYIPIKPISYNQSHVVVGQVLRSSTEKKLFDRNMSKLLTPFSSDLKTFACKHLGSPIEMDLRLIFWLPHGNMITKAGAISKNSVDIDNFFKSTTDAFFKRLEKYNKNINDAFITKMILEKKISPKNEYGITIHAKSEKLKKENK